LQQQDSRNRLKLIKILKYPKAEYICSCGNVVIKNRYLVANGDTKSCGCLKSESSSTNGKNNKTHGMTNTPTFSVWHGMLTRCNDKKCPNYNRYGGRGIGVAPEWMDFKNFFTDMGEKPKGKSIDRIDNNKGYSKDNCRWATMDQQQNNRSSNVRIKWMDIELTIKQWSDVLEVRDSRIAARIRNGWTIEDALFLPKGAGNTKRDSLGRFCS
jgi:hypothetical protein